jgi:hypothetical protein
MFPSKCPQAGSDVPSELDMQLNDVARQGDLVDVAERLIGAGANIQAINSVEFKHTAVHQAAFYGRYQLAKMLVQKDDAPLHWESNPCGREGSGTPIELARGGGFQDIVALFEKHLKAKQAPLLLPRGMGGGSVWRFGKIPCVPPFD